MDAVSMTLKCAYREAAPQTTPPKMAELLRKLQEQDKNGAEMRSARVKECYNKTETVG